MADVITKNGLRIGLLELSETDIKQMGAGTKMVLESPNGGAIGFRLSLQNMRDLLSSLAGAIQPAAERADELGLDDQDGPAGPMASAP